MSNKTECRIIGYDEWAHQAMTEAEGLTKGRFGEVTVTDSGGGTESFPCFEATIGFALELRDHLKTSGKPFNFKVAVRRTRERDTWRIADEREWIPGKKIAAGDRRHNRAKIPGSRPKRARVKKASELFKKTKR